MGKGWVRGKDWTARRANTTAGTADIADGTAAPTTSTPHPRQWGKFRFERKEPEPLLLPPGPWPREQQLVAVVLAATGYTAPSPGSCS